MSSSMEDNGKRDDSIITVCKRVDTPREVAHITVVSALKRIRDGKSKEAVEIIRQIQEKKERDSQKVALLPAYSFSGKFKFRANDGILESSGLICLDFDHLKNYDVWVEAMRKDDFIYSFFRSPSGDGIKVLVKIPKVIEKYGEYFDALRKYFKMDNYEGWDDLRDISRACFESYDPDLYWNPNSKVFDILIKPKPIVTEFASDDAKLTDRKEIYRRVKLWAERTNSYHDGNKHRFLVYISSACNRFGLDMEFVAEKLREDYQHKASPVDSKDFRDIVKRVYITYTNQHGNSYFTLEGEMSDFDPESPARDVIYLNDIREAMIQSFLKGDAKGETTYFNSIDPHWRWKRGEINVMHGIPGHGKTTLMLQLMLLKSIKEEVKWGIFSPEQNPPIDFYKDLIHMYVGKSTEHYHSNQMTLQEYKDAMDWMHEHFFFVYPKDDSPTPRYINDRFEELIIKHNIDGCLTDPFNQLTNDWMSVGGRDDKYIEAFMANEKRFALDHDVYKSVICHPKGNVDKVTEKSQDDDLMNAGNHEIPEQYSLAGGAMWYNKSDSLLCTYQPYYISRMKQRRRSGIDGSFSTYRHPSLVQFVSQKIKKQKLIGQPGTVNLYFDIITSRYYEEKENYEVGDEGAPYREAYCPFDEGYVHHETLAAPETQVSETDWSAFKKTEEEKKKEEAERKEREQNEKIKDELGVDYSEYAGDDSDYEEDDEYYGFENLD